MAEEKDGIKPEESEKPKKILVDPGVLEGILARLDEKDAQIEILRAAAGRYKLEEAESKNKPVGRPQANLMVFDGKVVVGWEMVKNKYIYNPLNPNVAVGEDLKIKFNFLDGSQSKEVEYIVFIRTLERTMVEKVSEEEGVWLVEFLDKTISDKQFKITTKFLNP